MTTVDVQLRNADDAICSNIELLADERALLSGNVLSRLRNLVEAAAVRLHLGSPAAEFTYDAVGPATAFVKTRANLKFLGRFHTLLQKSTSHYTPDRDASERLMLKYYEYLLKLRTLLADECGMAVLANLEEFPLDTDPALREYHDRIAARVNEPAPHGDGSPRRYYIHKTRPFFVDGRIYYEVTCYPAVNRVSKFDRIVAFTDITITDKYSAMLAFQHDQIEVFGQQLPITIVRDWEVSIRPCEFNNFAKLLGMRVNVSTSSAEYRYLMRALTAGSSSLLDLIDTSDDRYSQIRRKGTERTRTPAIFPILDRARQIIRSASPGRNLLRYLLLKMKNQIIKPQHSPEACHLLSDLNLDFGCIPFDSMPFCTSPKGHNPSYWDLMEALDPTGRDHELLARRVKTNVDSYGVLYTPVGELERFGDVNDLVETYNDALYYKHTDRRLIIDMDHVFLRGYENDTAEIVTSLQQHASTGVGGYTQAVDRWLAEANRGIDDPGKEDALRRLFSESHVAIIYGAAGTGKSTMVDHIANRFNDMRKLFLAHTHPATDNLRRRVSAQNSEFRTIASHNRASGQNAFDVVFIDECSTVSNEDMLKVLRGTSFQLLVLVGDVHQIESIRFGNWFDIIPAFVPDSAVFELTTPFRTTNPALLTFWSKVRALDDDIAEVIAANGYSSPLDESLLAPSGGDEIVLSLNYDGLYGINNINRFLQASNPAEPTWWRDVTYKVGDPVLFHETERFGPAIYNNLKGRIVAIDATPGQIRFDVKLDRPVTELDISVSDLEWVGDSTVRFSVYDVDISDDDSDALHTTVPFQVAYAVSIHKAQGLEYDSVKVVITYANEQDITHNIFYTAITRARSDLRIYWAPETQQAVLGSLEKPSNHKDVALLTARRGLTQTAGG